MAKQPRRGTMHTAAAHLFAGVVLLLGLGGCASQPVNTYVASAPPPRLPPTQVYFYPNVGQSAEQQDRDRFECYLWARKQSGFDPSLPQYAARVRVEVVPSEPPGHDMAIGAVSGAMIGAAVSHPHDAGQGALIGMIAGAAIGAASDAARQEQVERIQESWAYNGTQSIEQGASNFRRAMGACLEGRGYTVR